VAQAIREVVEADARIDRVSAVVASDAANLKQSDAIAKAAVDGEVSRLQPLERASVVDARAKALLAERGIWSPSESDYLDAAAQVERELLGATS
jgi:hypothetical protein